MVKRFPIYHVCSSAALELGGRIMKIHGIGGRQRRAVRLFAGLGLSAVMAAEGQVADPLEHPPYRIGRAGSAISIDGQLNEAAWQQATVIPLRFETRPGENIAARVETECLITYDESAFYAAFRAHDPNPQAIVAHLTDRDTAFADDFVGIVLDTFNDERRGFEFFVNPLGVQMDMFQDDVADTEDETWDAIWESAGRITESGYEVEIRIPWSSLRFPASTRELTWGLDAIRYYPREDRYRLSSHKLDRNISCYLCQATKITGFTGITPGRNLELAPTVTASRTDVRDGFPEGDFEAGDLDTEPGLTARWGITPNLSLNAALNPDFSQVEADAAQLAVNEQFALFFPEKRPFFLEGADFFSTRLNAVFTRNVADPRWGVKLTGKTGPHGLGLFAAEDTVTNLTLPGNESSSTTSLDLDTTDTVLRYRRDLEGNSAVGVLFTSRQGDGYANTVAGFDGLYRASETDTLRLQILGSQTEYPGEIVSRFEQPDGTFDDLAGVVAYNHSGRNWNWYAEFNDIGSGFRADMGFMPKVDYTFWLGGLFRTWHGKEGDWYNSIEAGGDWDLTEDQAGNLLEREVEGRVELALPHQTYVEVGGGVRDRASRGVIFDENFIWTYAEMQATGDLFFELFARAGDQIDFINNQLGEMVTLEPMVRWTPGIHTRFQLSHARQQLDVPGGRLFTADLTQLRLVYQFNLRTFLRTVFQYTDITRQPDLYTATVVEAKTERLFSQLLFSYKLNPQTVLFLGYSDNSLGDERIDLTRKDQTFFFKVGYAWVI